MSRESLENSVPNFVPILWPESIQICPNILIFSYYSGHEISKVGNTVRTQNSRFGVQLAL